MGDDILSQQAVDIYGDLQITSSQCIVKKRNGFSRKSVDKVDTSKLCISPQHSNLKFRNFAEENVFNVLANQSMLHTEVWKSQMALNDELIAAQVLEREEKQKQAVKYEKLLEEVEELRLSNHHKEKKICQLTTQNSNLKKNICSLYKTAKSEVEQKNCLLLNANEECDRLRRKLSKNSESHEFEQENLTPELLEIPRAEKEKICLSGYDHKRENCEDYKASHGKRRYYDHKETNYRSETSGNLSVRFHKTEINKKCKDICTNKNALSKYQNSESEVYSKRHEANTVKKRGKRESSKNLLNSKATKQADIKAQIKKNVKLDNKTEKEFSKCTSLPSKRKKIEDNLVSTSGCTDNKFTSTDISSRKSNNCNHISALTDKNIETEEYNQIAESNSQTAEQNVEKKQKFLQPLSVNSNLLTPFPTNRKCFENGVSTALNTVEHDVQSEGLTMPLSENNDNKCTPDLPDVDKYNFLNDKTITNALFFGLLPNEIKETFLEYEQRLITMINNLRQNFVNYCLNSTTNNLLGVFPEVIDQTFTDYEQRLIIITNRLKQTFVNCCLTHAEKDAQETPVLASDKTQNNFKEQYEVDEFQADGNETVSHLPPLLQEKFKITKNLDYSNKSALFIETAVVGVKSMSDISKNELDIRYEKNKIIKEKIENQVKQNQTYECVENPLTCLGNENNPVCAQDDERDSDSTQKVPSYYRKVFLSNEKNAFDFVNNTPLNTEIVNHSKDDESVSLKSVTTFNSLSSLSNQSNSNVLITNPHSSTSFHPSLSSVYYRRQLLKAAIDEKAEKGLSKLTLENINNLYRFRKSKIPFIDNKKYNK